MAGASSASPATAPSPPASATPILSAGLYWSITAAVSTASSSIESSSSSSVSVISEDGAGAGLLPGRWVMNSSYSFFSCEPPPSPCLCEGRAVGRDEVILAPRVPLPEPAGRQPGRLLALGGDKQLPDQLDGGLVPGLGQVLDGAGLAGEEKAGWRGETGPALWQGGGHVLRLGLSHQRRSAGWLAPPSARPPPGWCPHAAPPVSPPCGPPPPQPRPP